MDRVRCFFMEEISEKRYSLRRYVSSDSSKGKCVGRFSYHNAMEHYYDQETNPEKPPKDDPRWPFKCDSCDYHFGDDDHFQVFEEQLYRRVDTGELFTVREAPSGALWHADWYLNYPSMWKPGPDGHFLMCKLPNGLEWQIDGRASNCTRTEDRTHKCWVRNGTPPDVDVGKGGDTCAAGAGSISAGDYHGFLRNGWLERC